MEIVRSEVSTGHPQMFMTLKPQFYRPHTMITQGTRKILVAASKRAYICQECLRKAGRSQLRPARLHVRNATRYVQTASQPPPLEDTSFRKTLKDATKQQRNENVSNPPSEVIQATQDSKLEKWELTVGIEVHAELNTARKLFSKAATSISETPNTHVALFDTAFPGSQPCFQRDTLIPAIRAALALNCQILPKSSFDRKHYFYQDQPAGYQITQYYEPFAKDGHLDLYPHDFPPGAAYPRTRIGIKQVQMEQDTAKTVQQPPSTHLLDFNRVSHPLIEIITLPQIHDPVVAAVAVRKIQTILKSVNACTAGMELGGLRADINVSVRERNGPVSDYIHSYHGVTGLGQRTEIKNLASVKAVEEAIIAERDRQIDILESGGVIEGETRGWTLGSKTTKRLRGKEGEIDYRYMPDPDIPPVLISQSLIMHLKKTLPPLPDRSVDVLVHRYGLTTKDALTLLSLDGGDRVEYMMLVVKFAMLETMNMDETRARLAIGQKAGNWVLMKLGSLFKDEPWDPTRVPPSFLADIINHLRKKKITSRSAQRILAMRFEGDERAVHEIVHDENLYLKPLSRQEYIALAKQLLQEKPDMVKDIKERGQVKKIKWFVGQMMARSPEGSVEPDIAEKILEEVLGLAEQSW